MYSNEAERGFKLKKIYLFFMVDAKIFQHGESYPLDW